MADAQRVLRLIGDGSPSSGGGLPLPDAFTAITEHILDEGPADLGTLTRVIREALHYKEKRILQTAWRSWIDFTRDVTEQLRDAGVLDGNSDTYRIAAGYVPGRRHVVIPQKDIGFTAREEKDRQRREADAVFRTELRALITRRQQVPVGADTERAISFVSRAVDALADSDSRSRPPGRQHYGVAPFTRMYLADLPAGTEVTFGDIPAAWAQTHPDSPPLVVEAMKSARTVFKEMTEAGYLSARTEGKTKVYTRLPREWVPSDENEQQERIARFKLALLEVRTKVMEFMTVFSAGGEWFAPSDATARFCAEFPDVDPKVAREAVQREIQRLKSAGFLEMARLGRPGGGSMSRYRAAGDVQAAGTRPSAEQIARAEYGLGGGVTRRRGFGTDGLRECEACGRRLPPAAFEVYWYSRNGSYYLQGSCTECRNS